MYTSWNGWGPFRMRIHPPKDRQQAVEWNCFVCNYQFMWNIFVMSNDYSQCHYRNKDFSGKLVYKSSYDEDSWHRLFDHGIHLGAKFISITQSIPHRLSCNIYTIKAACYNILNYPNGTVVALCLTNDQLCKQLWLLHNTLYTAAEKPMRSFAYYAYQACDTWDSVRLIRLNHVSYQVYKSCQWKHIKLFWYIYIYTWFYWQIHEKNIYIFSGCIWKLYLKGTDVVIGQLFSWPGMIMKFTVVW